MLHSPSRKPLTAQCSARAVLSSALINYEARHGAARGYHETSAPIVTDGSQRLAEQVFDDAFSFPEAIAKHR